MLKLSNVFECLECLKSDSFLTSTFYEEHIRILLIADSQFSVPSVYFLSNAYLLPASTNSGETNES